MLSLFFFGSTLPKEGILLRKKKEKLQSILGAFTSPIGELEFEIGMIDDIYLLKLK